MCTFTRRAEANWGTGLPRLRISLNTLTSVLLMRIEADLMRLPNWQRYLAVTLTVLITAAALFVLQHRSALSAKAIGNVIAQTPPMAWDPWNYFVSQGTANQCAPDNNTYGDAYFRAIADGFVSSGLSNAGYNTIMLACGPEYRDSNGNLQSRPGKFPNSSIPQLISYIHSKGLQAEVYTDAGQGSCLTNGIGSYDHITQDAQTWASWGADAIKIDWCGGNAENRIPSQVYPLYRDAIARATASTGHPMWIEACEWGQDQSYLWGPATANFWRTGPDIAVGTPNWDDVMRNLDLNQHPWSAGPGHYNFPDMLLVGIPGLTATEQQAQMSMWAVMGSPLIIPFDPRTMADTTKTLVTNAEVIAVDQDRLAWQGLRVADGNGLQVYSKRLSDASGSRAVALLNRSSSSANITVNWGDLGLTNASATVRDLWAATNRGSFSGSYTVNVPSHGAALLKIVGTDKGSTTRDDNDAGWSFSGSWGSTTTSCDGRYNCTSHWSNQVGATATLTYTDSRAEIHLINGQAGGIVAISVDGGPETLYDNYYPVLQNDAPIAEFSGLAYGTHTLTFRVTGQANAASANTYVNIDRVITSP